MHRISDVPVSLHEEMVLRHHATDAGTGERRDDPVLDALARAMRGGREASDRARAVTVAVMRNENLTVPARHRRVVDETSRVFGSAAQRLDQARGAAEREIAALRAQAAPPPPPGDAHGNFVAGQVRDRLAAMSAEKRRAALTAAIAARDDAVIGAVVNAPAMLSGFADPAEVDEIRAHYCLARHPDATDRIARLERALGDAERGGSLMLGFFQSLSDPDIVAQALSQEAEAQAAIDAAQAPIGTEDAA